MKSFINRYRLKEGLFISIIFPVILFLLDYNPSNIFGHFIFSFLITFTFWIINYTFLDFEKLKIYPKQNGIFVNYGSLLFTFSVVVLIYISLALLLNRVGILLSPARGNWANSYTTWFYLCVKIIIFNTLIIFIQYLFHSNTEKRRIELENEILKRENLYALHESLRQQVNPHFLFNSLNTAKSLTKRDPQQAANFITELSCVYRYMIAHHEKNCVTVAEEIEFLKSYLFLLKIRFGDAINTEINLSKEFLKHSMPPNTLQLLIENAVKHNTLSALKPLFISIYAEGSFLTVQNNLQPKLHEEAASSRVGLSNINSRYLLLKGKEIIIKKDEKNFIVLLPLV